MVFPFFFALSASCLIFFPFQGETKGFQKPLTEVNEEAFLLKRIAEFWKDGDCVTVKGQILDFLENYPNAQAKDSLLAILGDVYFHENAYQEALFTYEKILDPILFDSIFLNKLHCYYELKRYVDLATEGAPYVDHPTPEIESRKEEFNFLMGEAFFRIAVESTKEEDRRFFARQSQRHYNHLPDGQYKEMSELSIAEIEALLGNSEIGARIYQNLAKKYPQMEEDLLFKAIFFQAKYDPAGAIDGFKAIQEKGGKRALEATFNLFVLLSQQKKDQEVVDLYTAVAKTIPKDLESIVNYIVGKSFFSLGEYEKALTALEHYRKDPKASAQERKQALLIEITCAHALNQTTLFSDLLKELETLFPNDPNIPHALFMHAMRLKNEGLITQATEKLKWLKENYPHLNQDEAFLFEYGFLAHQNEQWQCSYDTFKGFVTNFEQSPYLSAAWKLFLSSAFNLFKTEHTESRDSEESLFKDLQAVLDHSDCLSEEELYDCALFYAKIAYELDKYTEALSAIESHIFKASSEKQDPITLADAHLIASLCYAEGEGAYSDFFSHLQQAASLNPSLYHSPLTHLHLYNAYIALSGYGHHPSKATDLIQKKDWLDQAAAHLEELISAKTVSVDQENILWLANHFYQIVSEFFQTSHADDLSSFPKLAHAIDRGIVHYQNILNATDGPLSMGENPLLLEEAAIKLAQLFGYKNDHQKKIDLLEGVIEKQAMREEVPSLLQKEALFELAVAYQEIGAWEKALETYTFIQTLTEDVPTLLVGRSILEGARLHFQLLKSDCMPIDHTHVASILNDLKTLQICKHPSSEPLHLEAALEYAHMRSMIADQKDQKAQYYFFLNRIQEDFLSEKDATTQEYLTYLNQNPSQKAIFNAYMQLIDAEKLRLEAEDLAAKERFTETNHLYKKIAAVYREIQHTPKMPRALLKRIERTLKTYPLHFDPLESKDAE